MAFLGKDGERTQRIPCFDNFLDRCPASHRQHPSGGCLRPVICHLWFFKVRHSTHWTLAWPKFMQTLRPPMRNDVLGCFGVGCWLKWSGVNLLPFPSPGATCSYLDLVYHHTSLAGPVAHYWKRHCNHEPSCSSRISTCAWWFEIILLRFYKLLYKLTLYTLN